MRLQKLQERCLRDSRWWFPFNKPKRNTELDHEVLHYALGIAGESGEVVEHIKKWHRGSKDIDQDALGSELADVMIYCMNMAECLGIELQEAIDAKRRHNIRRWGKPE